MTAPPSDLDARALKARLEDRDTVIAVLRDRCQKLEAAIKQFFVDMNDPDVPVTVCLPKLEAALEVLPPERPK